MLTVRAHDEPATAGPVGELSTMTDQLRRWLDELDRLPEPEADRPRRIRVS